MLRPYKKAGNAAESMGEERKDDIETINDAIRLVKMERLGEYNRIYG